jgi:hypothetical protein
MRSAKGLDAMGGVAKAQDSSILDHLVGCVLPVVACLKW